MLMIISTTYKVSLTSSKYKYDACSNENTGGTLEQITVICN